MTKEKLDNKQNNYTVNWFATINDLWNLSQSFLMTLFWSFNWEWPHEEVLNNWIEFSEKKFYIYWEHIFLFEYSNMDNLNEDSSNWKERLKKVNSLTTETIEWKQILESSWYFEYNWKYYLLGLLYQDLNEDDNDENNWVYKWVIVNPTKYFKLHDESKKVAWKIDWIL